MNYFLSHTEMANLRYIIEENDRILMRLETLAQTTDNIEIRNKLHTDADSAKLAQSYLLSSLK